MSREALVLLVCCCDFRDGAEWLIPSKSLRNAVIWAFPGLLCILRMCAPRRAAAVVRPRGREKSADRRRRILISRLLIIRASVPRWKSPFPAYFKGFPAVSPLIPPYPAFLKYPVSPHMVPALSTDANARNQFASRATLFAGIGGTLASVLIPMFTVGDMAIGGSTTIAYGRIALIICIIAPLFLCFTVFGVRENREYTDAPPISFKKIWTTITGNDQLLWISLIFLLQQIGNGLIVGGIGSTYIYFDFGYEGGLFSLFSIVGMSVTAFLMIFYPAISRHIKRKKLMTVLACISVVGYALMLVAGLALPSTMLKFWIITVGYALSNFGQYGYYLIMMISIINTVEYNEYRIGSRDEAIITSLRPFLTKMSSALIVLVTNLSYIIFGVTKYTNQISDFENECARNLITEHEKTMAIDNVIAGIEPGKTLALLLCMVIVPCVLMLLSYFLYKKHYKLDEEEYDRICSEIAARKEAKA